MVCVGRLAGAHLEDCGMTARQRTRDIFVYVVGIVVVIGIVASFFVTRSEVHDVGSRVTKVESPCLRYGPKSDQCKEAFEAAVATITHPEACAVERKAGTLRAIRELAQGLGVDFKEPCAGARLAQERQRGNERDATSHLDNSSGDGGVAQTPASDGAPAGDGDSVDNGTNQGGSPTQHHPSKHPVSSPPPSSSEGGGGPVAQGPVEGSSGSAPTESSPPAEDSGGGSTGAPQHESVLESAGNTVGEVVHGTGEVLEATTCGLTGPLLCPKH
jgi:hypothetical protein